MAKPTYGRRLDLAELAVLGILHEGERHPYDIARQIKLRHQEEPPGHTDRSLYHAVEKLSGQGLIEAVETVRDGRRPERTVYRITEEGSEEFRHTLTDVLASPGLDSRMFKAAISRLGYLSEREVVVALGTRLAGLQGMAAHYEASARILRDRTGLPRLFLLELDFSLAQMRAESAWVEGLLETLGSGELDVSQEWLERMPAGLASGEAIPLVMQRHTPGADSREGPPAKEGGR
ncbi:MAG: PadR family transcriptional regulator [Candidatus Dormibacteria bacterium]